MHSLIKIICITGIKNSISFTKDCILPSITCDFFPQHNGIIQVGYLFVIVRMYTLLYPVGYGRKAKMQRIWSRNLINRICLTIRFRVLFFLFGVTCLYFLILLFSLANLHHLLERKLVLYLCAYVQ